jgi:hypothetical protein
MAKIRSLLRDLGAKRAEVARLEEELEWWQKGRDLFGRETADAHIPIPNELSSPGVIIGEAKAPSAVMTSLSEMVKGLLDSTHLTLRQSILTVMATEPGRAWKPAEVIEALERQGRMPTAKSGAQMVRNRLLAMTEGDNPDLTRDGDGYYQLAARSPSLLQQEPTA